MGMIQGARRRRGSRKLGGQTVGTEHLLLACCLQSDEVQASLERAGLRVEPLRLAINPKASSGVPGLDSLFAARARDELLPFSRDTERAFKASLAGNTDGNLVGPRCVDGG